MRQAVEGNALFSPFPFHSVYSVEDHKKHLDWIKMTNPRRCVRQGFDAHGRGHGRGRSYFAGAHIIHLDGSYGGTGAAPTSQEEIAMPIEYAIPKVHKFLSRKASEMSRAHRQRRIRTAHDVLKSIRSRDGAVIGTAELVALGCIRCVAVRAAAAARGASQPPTPSSCCKWTSTGNPKADQPVRGCASSSWTFFASSA